MHANGKFSRRKNAEKNKSAQSTGITSQTTSVACLVLSYFLTSMQSFVAAISAIGSGRMCFLKSALRGNGEILEHVMLPCADTLYGKAGSPVRVGLCTCPQNYK